MLPAGVRPLRGAEAVLAATGGDPYCRASLRAPTTVGWTDGAAVAWHGVEAEDGRVWLGVLGPPARAAGLLVAVAPRIVDPTRVTVPRGTPALLPAPWSLAPVDWDFRWTAAPPPVQPGEELVGWLPPEDEPEVAALLGAASPTASAVPGDPHVRRWCGLRDGDRLVAVAADTSSAPGVGHLSSIAVLPASRGRGLGATITAWLTRSLLAEVPLVALGMYATNTVARGMYDRLGYADDHRMSSGVLRHDGEPVPPADPHG